MNGYDQHSMAFMSEARHMKRMPEAATTKPSRPREAVNGNVAEALSTEDLATLFQIFQPRGKEDMSHDNWGGGDWGADMCEAPLNARRRNRLPASDFALPGRRYPIDTEARARSALARGAVNASVDEFARIIRAVKRRYPDMDTSGAEAKLKQRRSGSRD